MVAFNWAEADLGVNIKTRIMAEKSIFKTLLITILAVTSGSDLHVQMIRTVLSFRRHLPLFLLLLLSWTFPCRATTTGRSLLHRLGKPSSFSSMWLLAIFLVGAVVVVCVFMRFSSKGKSEEDGIVNEKKIDTKSAPRASGSGEDGTENEQVDNNSDPSTGGLGEDDLENEKTNSESEVVVGSSAQISKTYVLPDRVVVQELSTENDELTDGKMVNDRLFVSAKKMEYGRNESNAYEVFWGVFGKKRSVAVKCLDLSQDALILNEIGNHCLSDDHSNIIRFHGVEQDQNFAYICLEPWKCSLDDLIKLCVRRISLNTQGKSTKAVAPLDPLEKVMEKINFWKDVGKPLPIMLKLMRDIVSGLAHLHELGIVHRDLNPHNVLVIVKEMTLIAKISDMSLSKHLGGEQSAYKHLDTCYGNSGWQTPEQLRKENEDFPVDMYRFGCILYYAMTGYHPFGGIRDRKTNILGNNAVNLSLVKNLEALNLIEQLLNPKPNLRPSATKVLLHPMFWDSEKRLFFLREASDRIEHDKNIWQKLESSVAPKVIKQSHWDSKLNTTFIKHIKNLPQRKQSHRQYDYTSLRNLLRLIRNTLSHQREILDDPNIQNIVGKVPERLDSFFTDPFPDLMMEIYAFISKHCKGEEEFQKYFN
ncbi:unnamed protein product [Arabidopsis lyrata]|nr:unnamed protein product [Arabidopsis lyrata]